MSDLKETHSSLFPVKLLMTYIVSFSLIPTISFFADFGHLEGELEGWNADLEFSLILCVPLLWVIILAVWHFRRMPVFAGIMILIAMWHISDTLGWYFSDGFGKGFAPGFELDLQPLSCLIAALVWAMPFVIIYFVWLLWNRRKESANRMSLA